MWCSSSFVLSSTRCDRKRGLFVHLKEDDFFLSGVVMFFLVFLVSPVLFPMFGVAKRATGGV